MRITRDKHWQFLEDELKATTEEFQVKFEASARRLLDEKGEMFVAIFESFNKNGSMVMKFPNTRPIPRKGAHQMCMLLPKELRSENENYARRAFNLLLELNVHTPKSNKRKSLIVRLPMIKTDAISTLKSRSV